MQSEHSPGSAACGQASFGYVCASPRSPEHLEDELRSQLKNTGAVGGPGLQEIPRSETAGA